MAGKGTQQLTTKNLELITNNNVNHYVIQKDISPIFCELRLVYGPNQEFLGTRAYYDRRAPWENKATSNKAHKALNYNATNYLKTISKKIISYAGVEVGSADWLVTIPSKVVPKKEINKKELEYIINNYAQLSLAEVNGFGTNLGPLVSPYNLNELVAKKIANKYLV